MASFPAAQLAEATNRVLCDAGRAGGALQYGRVQGYTGLTELLADKLDLNEGLKVRPEDLLISNGSSGAIGLAARLLIDEGDTVLVEGPSFPVPCRSSGARARSFASSGSVLMGSI